MGDKTAIEWCDRTWNAWMGCQRTSEACRFCYAESWANRYGVVQWGATADRRRTAPTNWRKPAKWQATPWLACRMCGWRGPERDAGVCWTCPQCESTRYTERTRQRIFVNSLSDFFEDRPELTPWREEAIQIMLDCDELDFLLLTKRPENINRLLDDIIASGSDAGIELEVAMLQNAGRLPANWWVGTTVENQHYAEKRIPELLAVPAQTRFLSMEPLLGPVDLAPWLDELMPGHTWRDCLCGRIDPADRPCVTCGAHGIHWVIVGGESSHYARPMDADWARWIHAVCLKAAVPFFFKQGSQANWGRYKDYESFPPDLQFRSFPQMQKAHA